MSSNCVIDVNNITKSFKIYTDRGKTLKDMLSLVGKGSVQNRQVIKGISFRVNQGEAIGLIGKNGCGKSTTLKMLTRIMYPDSGSIDIKGKVSSLLELGAGFHPDMSGRENIYLNASVFGMTKKQIDHKVDEIISFSELEEFIESPVRTYSSGMYMRLAFSVAINVEADILLIDEILGVGDVSFQKKCFEKLKEIKKQGTTIVIVSHALEQIEEICDRCIWIHNGKIREEGLPVVVNARYFQAMEDERLNRLEVAFLNKMEEGRKNTDSNAEDDSSEEGGQQDDASSFYDEKAIRAGDQTIEFVDVHIKNAHDKEEPIFTTNDTLKVQCKIKSNIGKARFSVSVSISRDDGVLCYGVNSFKEMGTLFEISDHQNVELQFVDLNLLSGMYWLNIILYSPDMKEYDAIKCVKRFHIYSTADGKEFGVCQMKHHWKNSNK